MLCKCNQTIYFELDLYDKQFIGPPKYISPGDDLWQFRVKSLRNDLNARKIAEFYKEILAFSKSILLAKFIIDLFDKFNQNLSNSMHFDVEILL